MKDSELTFFAVIEAYTSDRARLLGSLERRRINTSILRCDLARLGLILVSHLECQEFDACLTWSDYDAIDLLRSPLPRIARPASRNCDKTDLFENLGNFIRSLKRLREWALNRVAPLHDTDQAELDEITHAIARLTASTIEALLPKGVEFTQLGLSIVDHHEALSDADASCPS